jgi:hypothetical protein
LWCCPPAVVSHIDAVIGIACALPIRIIATIIPGNVVFILVIILVIIIFLFLAFVLVIVIVIVIVIVVLTMKRWLLLWKRIDHLVLMKAMLGQGGIWALWLLSIIPLALRVVALGVQVLTEAYRSRSIFGHVHCGRYGFVDSFALIDVVVLDYIWWMPIDVASSPFGAQRWPIGSITPNIGRS